jgi:hypothetical protein
LYFFAQYWQSHLSRKKTLNLVKAGLLAIGTYSFKASTLGNFIWKFGELTVWSYSDITFTLPLKMALTASCQGHVDKGK